MIDYHVHGAYGTSIGAEGFEGYIRCLQERQQRELGILAGLSVKSIILDNPQRDWRIAREGLWEVFDQEWGCKDDLYQI